MTTAPSTSENPGLEELAARALTRDAALPAIEFEGRSHTWGEMRHVAERIGALIEASGAHARAPVALVARNRPSAVAAILALVAQGRTIRMIYPFQSPAGVARDIVRLKPAVVIAAAQDFSEEALAALRAENLAAIALTEMDATIAAPGLERTQHALGEDAPVPPRIEILTSGTTGPPKQYPISYEMIATNFFGPNLMFQGQDPTKLPPALLYFPVGNISGIYSTLPALIGGLRAILLDRFSVKEWRDYVVRYRPVHSGMPPAGVQMLLDANIPPEDLASIKTFGTGAAPLDPTVQRAFEERYGIPVLLSYGATEFGGPVTNMTPELHAVWGKKKFGSVGRAFGGAQLRVIDPASGAVLPPGEEGILEVISPRIGPDWIRTSDVGMIDEDGFIFLRGRADGAIMRGGFKVLPETIERALMLHPAISEAAVVGVADKRLGQTPAAMIKLKPNVEPPSFEELAAHLRQHVMATHIPVHWRYVEDLPRTPSMKADRPGVRRLFEET